VIATAVWKEGINIPSLDVVINAAGGKSEIQTLQSIGRGLRRTEEKLQVIVVDFFDATHKMLIAHFGERVSLYFDLGWMGGEA
jgi:superfamily II DNA or RNA helicase